MNSILKVEGVSVAPDESNIIDLRDRGICEECQIKVIEAIMGKEYELKLYEK
jgi:hypothetical protein